MLSWYYVNISVSYTHLWFRWPCAQRAYSWQKMRFRRLPYLQRRCVSRDVYKRQPPVRVESCLKCGLCAMECPGGALQNGAFDQAKCLSAITQKKKNLTQQEIDLIRTGGLVWGCDRCQEVCPMNRHAQITPITAFRDGVDPWFRADPNPVSYTHLDVDKRQGRNDPCPCGSGKKYKKCCGQ